MWIKKSKLILFFEIKKYIKLTFIWFINYNMRGIHWMSHAIDCIYSENIGRMRIQMRKAVQGLVANYYRVTLAGCARWRHVVNVKVNNIMKIFSILKLSWYCLERNTSKVFSNKIVEYFTMLVIKTPTNDIKKNILCMIIL